MAGYVDHLMSEHEHLVLVTHQHWSVLLRSLLLNLLFVVLIVLVSLAIRASVDAVGSPLAALSPFAGVLLIIAGLLLLIPIARLVHDYLVYTNREYIITNRRVIQVDGIVNKNVTDSSLEKVNDVKMVQSVLGRLLDYGDVEILTASELGANLFRRISHPVKFKTAMLNEKEALETPQVATAAPAAVDVTQLIAGLDQLRKQGLITEEEFQSKKAELLSRI